MPGRRHQCPDLAGDQFLQPWPSDFEIVEDQEEAVPLGVHRGRRLRWQGQVGKVIEGCKGLPPGPGRIRKGDRFVR